MTLARPDVTVVVGVVLMALALVLQIVGVAAPGWGSLWIGEKGDTMVGLWEYCYELPKFTCEDVEGLWPDQGWLETCRAFGVIAILVQGACLLAFALLCCVRQFSLFFAVTAWTALGAGLLIFVEFGVYVGMMERRQNYLGRDFEYHYAFVLTILAFFFSLLASLFFFVGEAQHRRSERLL